MNNLTHLSKNIIKELDSFNIKVKLPNFDILKKYHDDITSLYKSLDKMSIIETGNDYIKNNNNEFPCNTIAVIKYLRNNQEVQNYIYKTFEYSSDEIKETYKFINNIDDYNLDECSNWINSNGKKLARGIYDLLKFQRIPDELFNRMNISNFNIYGEFTSVNIQKFIEKYINTSKKYEIDYLDRYKAFLDFKTHEEVAPYNMYIICKRCLILAVYHQDTNPINIEFFRTENKKVLNPDSKLLGPREINSGSTSFGQTREICIWREEECKKLIVHELIHYHDIDFKHYSINKIISDNFNINPNIEKRLFEAYTETWACIINCILCSYENSNKVDYNLFKKLLKYEILFNIFQTSKILVYYGFKDINDFIKPYDGKDRFQQSTSVFSYFFVKTALLLNLDKFIEFVKSHCDGNIMLIGNDKKINNDFINLILDIKNNYNLTTSLNKCMKTIKNKKYSDFLKNSLRMTCVEI